MNKIGAVANTIDPRMDTESIKRMVLESESKILIVIDVAFPKIKAIMDDLREKRVSKQPLEYPSAGSTFKRPEGYFAGKLIQDAGLRGFRVGGAQVSEKHCGFVINAGDATAKDVDDLMKQVSAKVMEQFGVVLEPEVKRLGEF